MRTQLFVAGSFAVGALAQLSFSNTSITTTTFTGSLSTISEPTQTLTSVGSPILTSLASSTESTSRPTGTVEPSLFCNERFTTPNDETFLILCNFIAGGETFFSTTTDTLFECIGECASRGTVCAAAQFDNRTAPATCNLKTVNNNNARRQNANFRGTFAAIRLDINGQPAVTASSLSTATAFPTLTFSNATITTMTGAPTVQPTLNYFTSSGSLCYFRSALVSDGTTLFRYPLPTA